MSSAEIKLAPDLKTPPDYHEITEEEGMILLKDTRDKLNHIIWGTLRAKKAKQIPTGPEVVKDNIPDHGLRHVEFPPETKQKKEPVVSDELLEKASMSSAEAIASALFAYSKQKSFDPLTIEYSLRHVEIEKKDRKSTLTDDDAEYYYDPQKLSDLLSLEQQKQADFSLKLPQANLKHIEVVKKVEKPSLSQEGVEPVSEEQVKRIEELEKQLQMKKFEEAKIPKVGLRKVDSAKSTEEPTKSSGVDKVSGMDPSALAAFTALEKKSYNSKSLDESGVYSESLESSGLNRVELPEKANLPGLSRKNSVTVVELYNMNPRALFNDPVFAVQDWHALSEEEAASRIGNIKNRLKRITEIEDAANRAAQDLTGGIDVTGIPKAGLKPVQLPDKKEKPKPDPLEEEHFARINSEAEKRRQALLASLGIQENSAPQRDWVGGVFYTNHPEAGLRKSGASLA